MLTIIIRGVALAAILLTGVWIFGFSGMRLNTGVSIFVICYIVTLVSAEYINSELVRIKRR